MEASSSNFSLKHVATLTGHTGPVTAIATPSDTTKNFIVSASRGISSLQMTFNIMDGLGGCGNGHRSRTFTIPLSPPFIALPLF